MFRTCSKVSGWGYGGFFRISRFFRLVVALFRVVAAGGGGICGAADMRCVPSADQRSVHDLQERCGARDRALRDVRTDTSKVPVVQPAGDGAGRPWEGAAVLDMHAHRDALHDLPAGLAVRIPGL